MTLYCEVNLKDKSPSSIRDAIAYANTHDEVWHVKLSKQERKELIMSRTDLTNRCGSCTFFKPFDGLYCGSSCYGECKMGHTCGARTRKACKKYERAKQ